MPLFFTFDNRYHCQSIHICLSFSIISYLFFDVSHFIQLVSPSNMASYINLFIDIFKKIIPYIFCFLFISVYSYLYSWIYLYLSIFVFCFLFISSNTFVSVYNFCFPWCSHEYYLSLISFFFFLLTSSTSWVSSTSYE